MQQQMYLPHVLLTYSRACKLLQVLLPLNALHSCGLLRVHGLPASVLMPSDADVQTLSELCEPVLVAAGWDKRRSTKRVWDSRCIFKEECPAEAIKHVWSAG